jgi:hypothetical protein
MYTHIHPLSEKGERLGDWIIDPGEDSKQHQQRLKMMLNATVTRNLPVISLLAMIRGSLVLLFVGMLLAKVSGQQGTLETETHTQRQSYGVDVSFPMQHPHVSASPRPLGDGMSFLYNQYLQGCQDFYKEKNDRSCHAISQSNYTTIGSNMKEKKKRKKIGLSVTPLRTIGIVS